MYFCLSCCSLESSSYDMVLQSEYSPYYMAAQSEYPSFHMMSQPEYEELLFCCELLMMLWMSKKLFWLLDPHRDNEFF